MKPEGGRGSESSGNGIVAVELRFTSMRQFQAEIAPNLSSDGIFIPHPEPFPPSTVVRFAVRLADDFLLLEGVGVVLWCREEPASSDQPTGMALRFASLGPRSQELIDSIVVAHLADGGRPFELDSFGDGDEFIPTDALAGRNALPEHRPLPSLRDRSVEDETPRLKVRGVDDGSSALPPAVVPLEDEVTAVSPRREAEPKPAAVAQGPDAAHPSRVSEGDDGAVRGVADPATQGPTGPEEGPEVGGEPAYTLPPRRSATRPARAVERTQGEAEQAAAASGGVTAAELVAEVIADEELRAVRQGEGAAPGESDQAVDVFADSLRTLERPAAENHVGMAPEVTIVPRDDEEPEEPTRRMPWAAVVAVAVVLTVAATGYLARERVARLLVPESPGAVPGLEQGAPGEGGPAPPTATPTQLRVYIPTRTPTAVAVTPSPVPATPTPVSPPQQPTAVPPAPTAAPTPAPRPARTASRVEDIRWAEVGGRTVVTIVADGALSEDRVRVGTMDDPPRVLVRLLRVERFPRYELAAGTGELERIRTGHHPEQSPPSLHVVLDLTGPGVRLVSTAVDGAEVRLTLGR